jgi:hypothetical protein
MIVVSCAIGCAGQSNVRHLADVGFGVVGYVFRRSDSAGAVHAGAGAAAVPIPPPMIGSWRQKVFWSNGLVGSITTLAIVLCSGGDRRGLAASAGCFDRKSPCSGLPRSSQR